MLGLEAIGRRRGEHFHLLAHPLRASALLEISGQLEIHIAQVCDIGRRIGELRLAERPTRPVGEAVRLVQGVAGDALHELVIRDGIAIAQHHGGDLRVDDRRRDGASFVPANFDILPGGVKYLGDVLVCHQCEKGSKIDAHRERVDNDRLFETRHLRDAEPRVIGVFAQELGIDRDKGMPRQARAGVREFLGRRDRLHGG